MAGDDDNDNLEIAPSEESNETGSDVATELMRMLRESHQVIAAQSQRILELTATRTTTTTTRTDEGTEVTPTRTSSLSGVDVGGVKKTRKRNYIF